MLETIWIVSSKICAVEAQIKNGFNFKFHQFIEDWPLFSNAQLIEYQVNFCSVTGFRLIWIIRIECDHI